MEELGADLVKKYPAAKDRGQIYYRLCHVYAQSGQARPGQTIAYAKKALECPLEPLQKLMAYTYWGDAEQLADRKKPFAERRKAAAALYLNGLKEASKLNLPDVLPAAPAQPKVTLKPTDPGFIELLQQHQKELAAYRKTEPLRELVRQRDILTGQIAQLYGRLPLSTQEIEETARAELADPPAVDRLMVGVRAAVSKAEARRPKAEVAESAELSAFSIWLLIGAGVGVVVIALYALPTVLRKFQKGRKAG